MTSVAKADQVEALIAAAPELRDFALDFLSFFGSDDPNTNIEAMYAHQHRFAELQRSARAAIEKSTLAAGGAV